MNLGKFYKYSMYIFFISILFTPIGSELWKPLGFVGMVSGIMWVKNIIV